MIWAKNEINERIYASPKLKASCPLCNKEVISKCGSIKIRHWAHKKELDCDSWSEGETEWHLNWKNNFPKECQEFIMGKHIADVRTKSRTIIEFQNSPISPENIIEREDYYHKMVWVINGQTLCRGMNLRKKKGIITFRWKHPPKSFWSSTKNLFIDFSDFQEESGTWVKENDYMNYTGYWKKEADEMKREIFWIKKLHKNIPCGGWGEMISKEEFIRRFS